MKKFIITEDFLNVFPEAKIGIVLSKGICNEGESGNEIKAGLEEANNIARKFIQAEVFSENEVVASWRQAYQKFKTKKGARCSIEAMLKRINSGNHINSINPLVDIYNTISLTYGIPCGGEDIDTFEGDVLLTKALGDEHFVPLGSSENDSPLTGEIIYKDNCGAICRCWNWREAQRTMLTDKTKNAFLILECFDDSSNQDFQEAIKELSVSVQKHLGGESQIYIMDKDNRQINL